MSSIVCVAIHPSPIGRKGLRSILAKSPFEPACTASSIEGVPSTIAGAGKQVLILIGVRQASDLANAVQAAKASFPDAPVMVIGDAGNGDLVMSAFALGATSFVDENVATSILIKELELMVQGEPVISVLLLKRLLGLSSAAAQQGLPMPAFDAQQPDTRHEAIPGPHLSDREAAILDGLVQGASNKVIANELNITEATVKVHVKALLRKTRVKNRTQVAIWALHRRTLPKILHPGNDELPVASSNLSCASASPVGLGPKASGGSDDGVDPRPFRGPASEQSAPLPGSSSQRTQATSRTGISLVGRRDVVDDRVLSSAHARARLGHSTRHR